MKSKLRLNASGFSIIYSIPPFANTMLAEVVLDKSELPREVFQTEVKENLKKLYDRDWKRIK